ncbi:hypothetical protein AWB99_21645 [Mycolicibacterium confluentis]|uniref:Uncharacterized protein n=2 Tax=Mycolicibacterium confluentis TaxID=28047 RepID=A0A7I7Y472_9MYCO|nr:hypothetical protein [Mycolicibacterium confluentis]MCV7319342.1 hypothetical protein [Mycolicibacterium confluentis]ORV25722.1 hypothetical protein AWB99_21645 [Mycolicibacterium confluentis]BBZ36446.1 hypothetical protein MCNF_50510 [Mycolicibacterium confluentis]
MFHVGVAAVAVSIGILGAPAPGVAWADSTESTTSVATPGASGSGAGSADNGSAGPTDRAGRVVGPLDFPKRFTTRRAEKVDERPADLSASVKGALDRAKDRWMRPVRDTDISDSKADRIGQTAALSPQTADGQMPEQAPPIDPAPEVPVIPEPVVVEPDPAAKQGSAPETLTVRDKLALKHPLAPFVRTARQELSAVVATLTPPSGLPADAAPNAQTPPVRPSGTVPTEALAPLAALVSTTTVDTTPTPPQPLSPVAKLLELPGRIVNAVLEALDFTSSANSPTLPIGLGPINDLIFGAFREIERLLGLWETPPPQPAVPTMVYDGPTDRLTPTVAQFLNASTAAYVLGSTPGDLKPFVVNGRQMSRTNILTGMVGKAWVTPEGQVIIAYQGTTGGTHLLFNPLIAIPQLIADLQVVFTGTTPWAFYDAHDFAEEVLAEAALQGYSEDDVFVTGHSLGGWEAQYVAQQTGLAGIGFEAPGINTTVDGNGADSMFVNIGTYGSSAPYMATDLPGLQPFMPPFVPGGPNPGDGGSKPHYGPIVMVGDPAAMTPLYNASALWGKSLTGSVIFMVDYLMNFFQYHLPGIQAYHLDVTPDPGVVPFLGTARGPVHAGYGKLTIPELLATASDDGILFAP